MIIFFDYYKKQKMVIYANILYHKLTEYIHSYVKDKSPKTLKKVTYPALLMYAGMTSSKLFVKPYLFKINKQVLKYYNKDTIQEERKLPNTKEFIKGLNDIIAKNKKAVKLRTIEPEFPRHDKKRKKWYFSNKLYLPEHLYEKLKKFYIGKPEEFNQRAYETVQCYALMNETNMHLAFLPEKYNALKKAGYSYECFGSPYNRNFKNLCTLFSGVDKYFGAVGNFFDTVFDSKIKYVANPPYVNTLMTKVATKILKEAPKGTEFSMVIPIWDKDLTGRLKVSVDDYGDYKIMTKFRNAAKKGKIHLEEKEFKTYYYWNWWTNKKVKLIPSYELYIKIL